MPVGRPSSSQGPPSTPAAKAMASTRENSPLISEKDVRKLLSRYLPEDPSVGDETLYQVALLHRSCIGKHDARGGGGCADSVELPKQLMGKSYERLEFLGDAVLGLVTASYLYERYPGEDEGFLTRLRVKLVNGKMLASLCSKHTPLPAFVVGRSELSQDIVEDVFEAFVGAMYVDRGYDAVHRWVVGFLEDNVDFAELVANQASARAQLNRHCSKNLGYLPEARVVSADSGVVRVQLTTPAGIVLSTGAGPNKKDAEDHAVRVALAYLVPAVH